MLTPLPTKAELRARCRRERAALSNRDELSAVICDHVRSTEIWQSARVIGLYVHTRNEVQTLSLLTQEWAAAGRRLAVPYCDGELLRMIEIRSWDELIPGSFQIPEPVPRLVTDPTCEVAPDQLDLLLVPGVAFDRRGHRLGQGKGYYDRLLTRLRNDCPTIGLAFGCQLVEAVPTEPHDIPVQLVITESGVFPLAGAAGSGKL